MTDHPHIIDPSSDTGAGNSTASTTRPPAVVQTQIDDETRRRLEWANLLMERPSPGSDSQTVLLWLQQVLMVSDRSSTTGEASLSSSSSSASPTKRSTPAEISAALCSSSSRRSLKSTEAAAAAAAAARPYYYNQNQNQNNQTHQNAHQHPSNEGLIAQQQTGAAAGGVLETRERS